MEIGTKSLVKGFDLIRMLYLERAQDIVEAAENFDELTVALSIKFAPNKKVDNQIDIDGGITFIKEKVKDSGSDSVNEGQDSLFGDEPGKISTMDISINGEKVAEGFTSDDLRRMTKTFRLDREKTAKNA